MNRPSFSDEESASAEIEGLVVHIANDLDAVGVFKVSAIADRSRERRHRRGRMVDEQVVNLIDGSGFDLRFIALYIDPKIDLGKASGNFGHAIGS